MTMPAKEAAKLLREHVEIRRKAGTGNPCLNQAIVAAVAALEAVAGAEPVCVGRAKYSRAGGNAGLAWFVEDAVGEHQYRTGSPKDGELLFVLPAACAKCGLADLKTHPRESALAHDAERGNFRAKP